VGVVFPSKEGARVMPTEKGGAFYWARTLRVSIHFRFSSSSLSRDYDRGFRPIRAFKRR